MDDIEHMSDLSITKVELAQRGGFAGLVRDMAIDLTTLSHEKRDALVSLVKASRLVNARKDAREVNSKVRDAILYTVTIVTTTGSVRAEYDETSMPDDVRAIVDFIFEECAENS